MGYQPLRIDPRSPKTVREFIRDHLDMQFHDVHCLLRLPLKGKGLDAGCNFAAAGFLLSVIAGLSTALFKQTGFDGDRFKELLEKYYPWDLEPAEGVRKPEEGSKILYDLFRNPLAHALGLDTKQIGKRSAKRVVLWRDKRRIRLVIGKGPGLSEARLQKLEQARVRPRDARGTLLRSRRKRVLLVEGLYWGVRELVDRLTHDSVLMKDARKFLRWWRDAV